MRADGPEKPESEAQDPERTERFRSAMEELSSAVARRKVELICTAYLQLRQAAGSMSARELIRRIEQRAGPGAPEMIVSGFSHRHCLMCDSGTIVCETCEGSGGLGKSLCPQCDGLGVEPCPFCQGSCWPDRSQTPHELASLIDSRRRSHVDKEVARLEKVPPPDRLVESLNGHRTDVAQWLFRLRARLLRLSGGQGQDAMRRQELLRRIDALLEALKRSVGNGGPPAESAL